MEKIKIKDLLEPTLISIPDSDGKVISTTIDKVSICSTQDCVLNSDYAVSVEGTDYSLFCTADKIPHDKTAVKMTRSLFVIDIPKKFNISVIN